MLFEWYWVFLLWALIVFCNKCVASGFSERTSRNQLAVRCRNFSLAPQKHFSLYLVPTLKHQGCPVWGQRTWMSHVQRTNLCWFWWNPFSQDVWVDEHWITWSSWFCQMFSLEENWRMWGGALPLLSHAFKEKIFHFSSCYIPVVPGFLLQPVSVWTEGKPLGFIQTE